MRKHIGLIEIDEEAAFLRQPEHSLMLYYKWPHPPILLRLMVMCLLSHSGSGRFGNAAAG